MPLDVSGAELEFVQHVTALLALHRTGFSAAPTLLRERNHVDRTGGEQLFVVLPPHRQAFRKAVTCCIGRLRDSKRNSYSSVL
jgi:hypothetical protein